MLSSAVTLRLPSKRLVTARSSITGFIILDASNQPVCDNPGLQAQLIPLVLTFGIALLLCLVARTMFLRILDRKITDKLTFAYTFLNAIRFPSVLWCLAAALAITIRNAIPSPTIVNWANKGIGAFTITSISLVVASITVRMIAVYGERHSMPFAVAGLSRTLARVLGLQHRLADATADLRY